VRFDVRSFLGLYEEALSIASPTLFYPVVSENCRLYYRKYPLYCCEKLPLRVKAMKLGALVPGKEVVIELLLVI